VVRRFSSSIYKKWP